ncbi:hypothetical protein JCM13664_20470 [Methylothermus subterraneus]
MFKIGWIVTLALVWLASALAETAILPVRHRLPGELVQALAPTLAKTERLVAVPEGLFVQASPARIEELKGLIAALDRPPKRLTVTVLQTDRFSLEELNAQAGIEADQNARAQARVYETRSQGSLGAKQRLETTEGQPAFIAVGQEFAVPVIHLFGPQAVGGIEYLPATTGFQVIPKLIGCRVRLEISPWARRPGGLGGELAVHAAKTVLEAPLGRWVELGASGLDEDLSSTEIPAHRYQTQARSLRLFVKVDAPGGCQ